MFNFSISKALQESFNIIKNNLGKVIIVMLAFAAFYVVPFLIAFLVGTVNPLLGTIFNLMDIILTLIITIGFTFVCIKLSNNEEIKVGDLFAKSGKTFIILLIKVVVQ